MLIKKGFRALTVDAVSAHSGASRSTIYRHWPSLNHLMFDAFAEITGAPFESPETGDFREDLYSIAQQFIDTVNTGSWLGLLPPFIEAAQHDEHFAELLAELVKRGRTTTREILLKARREGQLESKAKIDWMVDAINGPIMYRALLSGEPTDEKGYLKYLIKIATS
ncbi:TetR/AcrR family transcriptional regulator [Parahaliea mediterranea]|uniref:TetR/AcrR family transcriptional regulator n=2 Tax=Parahaliea mediterranea TaxID=651086 RepID=A0A939DHA6_9GAMM|nr:TetR/AcrR family transcriptional regulator [Parahaliea mediterranea]